MAVWGHHPPYIQLLQNWCQNAVAQYSHGPTGEQESRLALWQGLCPSVQLLSSGAHSEHCPRDHEAELLKEVLLLGAHHVEKADAKTVVILIAVP